MKRVTAKCILMAGLLVFSHLAKSDEWTAFNAKFVSDVIVSQTAYYITDTTSGWGSAGCPGAIYLAINRADPVARELLALVLTAKASNKKISAFGTCSGASYFNTAYIMLH